MVRSYRRQCLSKKLSDDRKAESSVDIRKRVTAAREIQSARFEEMNNIHYNAQMNTKHIREYCALDETSKQLLKQRWND
jgi:magnesium chelatase family protein